MKKDKILSLLIMFGFLLLGGVSTVKTQKLSNKTFKTWKISAGESGGMPGMIESYSLDSDGNFIEVKNSKTTTKKIDETDLQEFVELLKELKLPASKTKLVKGSRIYDGVYGGFTITLDGKTYKIYGDSFNDQKQVVLTATQKKTFDKLQEKFGQIKTKLSKISNELPNQANPLANTSWVIESYGARNNPQLIIANTGKSDPATGFRALVEFSDSKFSGRIAGCNIISYGFTVNNSMIKFQNLTTTVMECSDEIMKQEKELKAALSTGGSFRLDGEQLEFSYDTDKIVLLRQAKTTAPLDPAKQKMIFRYEYRNYARRFQQEGWYIDEQGRVYKYSYERIPDPQSANRFKLVFKVAPTLIAQIKPEILAEKRKLLKAVEKGKYTERQAANDAGTGTVSAFFADAQTGEYREVKLLTRGDYEGSNNAPEAEALVKWLIAVVPEFRLLNKVDKL